LRAVEYANEAGAITVGLTGFDGGRLRQLVSEHLHVPTAKGDYGPVEDLHLMLNHLITSYLVRLTSEQNARERVFARKRSAAIGEPVIVQAETA
jgi:hypothetical protein